MIRPHLEYRLGNKLLTSELDHRRSDMGEIRACAEAARRRGAEAVALVFTDEAHNEVARYGV